MNKTALLWMGVGALLTVGIVTAVAVGFVLGAHPRFGLAPERTQSESLQAGYMTAPLSEVSSVQRKADSNGAVNAPARTLPPVSVAITGTTIRAASQVQSVVERASSVVQPIRPVVVGIESDKISIQTAAQKICEQAGFTYDWERSYRNTNPECRRYISVRIARQPITVALNEIVVGHGLKYRIEGDKVWLER